MLLLLELSSKLHLCIPHSHFVLLVNVPLKLRGPVLKFDSLKSLLLNVSILNMTTFC